MTCPSTSSGASPGRSWRRGRGRRMIGSRPEPKPVPVRRYRYSKLRWRVLVHVLDAVGTVVMAIARRFRPAPVVDDPRSILLVQLDHMGDAVLTSPMLPRLR